MDCTITSTTRKGNKAGCAGMTLAELLMAIGISGMLFAAVSILIFFSGRSYAALANYVDLDNKSRSALDRMSKEIRQMDGVIAIGTNTLSNGQVVTNQLVMSGTNTTGTAYTLTYNYDPAQQTLTRRKLQSGVTTTNVLLEGCSYLNFGMYQRVPKTNSFEQFEAADLATCKVVQLDWICSRGIFNKSDNTESIETAKVVIRKK